MIVAISVCLALRTPLRAQPGSLDPAFNPTVQSRVLALAAQTDDILVGGNFQTVDGARHVALLRLFANGNLDNGFQQRNPDGSDVFSSVSSIVVEGGNFVVAGGLFSGKGTNGVARFNSDGMRDTSYDPSTDPNPFAVRQSDGRRLMVDGGQRIKRINPDGSFDSSFSSIQLGGGVSFTSNITAIAVQPNDKIIVATLNSWPFRDHGNVLRLDGDGNLDTSFTQASADIDIYAITVQHNGGIVIGGQFRTVNGVPRIGLARLIGDNPAEKPRITSQPRDRTTPVGGTVEFSVAVNSVDLPTFQWRFNGSDIPGATNRVLELVNVQLNQAGDYSVIVSNRVGSVESAVAKLVVLTTGCLVPTFDAARQFDAGSNPGIVAVGDFNGDANPDIAVASFTGVAFFANSTGVSVLLSKGDGTFQPAVNYGAGTNPDSVAIGDFNGDAKSDLVVANFGVLSASNSDVSVLLGNGDGTFQPSVSYSVGVAYSNPAAVAAGDFNGDGKLDVAVALAQSLYVSVLLGRGDGSFQNAVSYRSNPSSFPPAAQVAIGNHSVLVNDINGDGKLDLVVANPGQLQFGNHSGSVTVLLGNGDGRFQAAFNFTKPSRGFGAVEDFLAVGDFNRDRQLDLVGTTVSLSTGSRISWLLLNTCGSDRTGLAVARRNSGLTLSWPAPSTDLVLESATSLTLTNWRPVAETPTTNSSRLELTVPLDQSQRFFRLRQP